MVASSWLPLASSGGHQTVHSWLTALPREVHRGDARLCVASAVTAISTGRLDEVGPWIDLAEEAPAAGPFHDGFASGAAAAGCLRAVQSWLTGDLVACRESALGASEAGGEPSPWDAVTYSWLGASTYWLGDSEAGIGLLEAGLERSRLANFPPPWVASLGMLGLIHLSRGELDQAQARTDAALKLSRQTGLLEYWINVAAHTAQAGLLVQAERLGEARSELDRALELARRGSGPVETIHTLVAHGLVARAAGEHDAARSSIVDARLLLTSCPNPGPVVTTLVDDASARLPRTTDQSRRAPLLLEDFSERELDVLRLLGGDLSQREIADLLFISFNTVKSHSKSIYRKLGVGSRTEAVGRARELAVI
jgi:LuxR family maltose regulon positive regulatory protein